MKVRALAYYLPQYYPIPENDAWWGKGFTEWTNVGKAKQLFLGHYQPHVPADLGYYDLRVPETREAQAVMAREYGIEGFIYWHYWFGGGKQLLERPFDEVLKSGKPDFPFCLAWANETWKGFLFGADGEREPLIEQTYPGDEDYIAHFYSVLPAFRDKRYIQCEGKPIFFIYKPDQLPDAKHFIELWRMLADENGLPGLYFIGIKNSAYEQDYANEIYQRYMAFGFDAMNVVNAYNWPITDLKYRITRKIFFKTLKITPDIRPYRYEQFKSPLDGVSNVFPTITPNWDHTPRTGKKGIVLYESSPEKFRECLQLMIDSIKDKDSDHRFLMIKSWNEWAEGNYLEPDLKYGRRYLEALRDEIIV